MARRRSLKKSILLILLLGVIAIQFIPLGEKTNPPIVAGPNWDSPQTEQLVRRACFDCHSNETKWPWYASIAPISWRVQDHVNAGRRHLNFSEFNKPQRHATEASVEVAEGAMPLWDYTLMHSESRLSDAEKQALIDGLIATFGPSRSPDLEEHDD